VTVCLDSWAVLAWLYDVQPAADRVRDRIREGAVMSWINAGEVFYLLSRSAGDAPAREALRDLRTVVALELPNEHRVMEAAAIKAGHALSYADAFAVATSQAHGVTLLTGDPEIIDADGGWMVEDLRH
jgi:predicted nucleic acid-binding protein